jgi:hypothetical protein
VLGASPELSERLTTLLSIVDPNQCSLLRRGGKSGALMVQSDANDLGLV